MNFSGKSGLLQEKLVDLYLTISRQRYLHAIKGGFVYLMPIMVSGSFAVLINNFPVPGYQELMLSIFGEGWTSFGSYLWSATLAIISLVATISISAELAVWYNANRGTDVSESQVAIISISSFIIVASPVEGFISHDLTGATSLFVAIIIAIMTTEGVVFLRERTPAMLCIILDEPDPRTSRTFSMLFPSIVVLVFFVSVRLLLIYFNMPPLKDCVYNLLQMPFETLGNSWFSAVMFNLAANSLWTMGIHGNNVLEEVAQNIFVPAVGANAAAIAAGGEPVYIFSKTFFDAFVYMGGAGATLCLILAILLFTRRSSQTKLAQFSIFPAIFNINEMLLYGLPIILNPIYIVPFILVPLTMLSLATVATMLGLVPYTVVEITWTSPILISGYLSTGGSWAGVVMQIVNLSVGVLMYMPFVKLAEKINEKRFVLTYRALCRLCEEDYETTNGLKLINRNDDIGALARLLGIELKNAIDRNEIYYLYQPIVEGTSDKVVGAEALLRWKHYKYGMISPMVVVAIAEDLDIVSQLGRLVLKTVVEEQRHWKENGLEHLYVSVNISSSELKDPQFSSQLMDIVERAGGNPGLIQIELTESIAISNDEITARNIREMHQNGFSLAIDDFGMGHSSLVYLKRFPVSTLKVDKALSMDVISEPDNLEIIASIIQLCRTLNVGTTIEYVENEEQLEMLKSIGESSYQGYFFSRPLLPADFIDYAKRTYEQSDIRK